jgi:hypothetical protein
MKKTKILGLLVLFGTCAISLSAQSLLKRTTVKTDKFDFGAGGTVAIAGAPEGSIHVTGSNNNEIEITATIELQARTEADLTLLSQVTGFLTDEQIARTGIISMGTHNKLGDKKLWKKFPKDLLTLPFRIDYVVSVPHYCDLEIDGGRGDLSVTGVVGSIHVSFVDTHATIEAFSGQTDITAGSGVVDLVLGPRGWRGNAASVQVASGDLRVRLPMNISAEIDALILRTGAIDNTFPDLKPRNRKAPFTDKVIVAKAGVGGPPIKLAVGDGNLRIERFTL